MAGALLVGPAVPPLPGMLGEGILGVLFPELPADFGFSKPMLDASLRFVMDPLGAGRLVGGEGLWCPFNKGLGGPEATRLGLVDSLAAGPEGGTLGIGG